MDFEQTLQEFPYFTDNLPLLVEVMQSGETVAVEGGSCLFGAYEVSEFDYANGKIYLSDAGFSDSDRLAQFVLRNGAVVVRIDFKQHKKI